jgi:membrane carboxypeptidase/penicillin-binding protein
MKRAHEHRQYRNVSPFTAPAGIVSAQIDPESGQLATANCPAVRTEFFIAGTEPVETCALHGGGGTRIAAWEITPGAPGAPNGTNPNPDNKANQKKGLFGKIREIFR